MAIKRTSIGGSVAPRDVREYTSSQSNITTPTGILGAYVTVIQPGHGGGSGRRGAAGTVRGGGQGGSPAGFIDELWVPAGMWPTTYSVNIGAAGVGGAAVTTDDTNGNAGTVGGNTNVAIGSLFIRTQSGSVAGGGTTAGGTGGSAGTPNPGSPTNGGAGGAGAVGITPASSFSTYTSSAAGGGGGISAGDVAFAGGAAGPVYPLAISGGAAGVVGGAAPTAPALVPGRPGAGAGGGAASTVGAAQAGADGLGYGAPGGGGGASVNLNNSGRGGNGGPGYVRVTFVHS